MFPTVTPIPWYSWIALGLVIIAVIGCWWTALKLIFGAVVLAFTSSWQLLCLAITKLVGAEPSDAGTAHFARRLEMRKAGVWNETGLALGTWKNGKTIREPRGSHVAVIAPPRSRKSWGVIMPNLRTYPGSCVITDLRGELHQHTAEARERFGPVWKFDPGSPDSCSINVLDGVRWNTPYTYGDVDRIAHHVLGPTGHAIQDGFRQNAIPLLRAVIMDRHEVGAGHFPGVSEWFTASDRTMQEKLDSLLNDSPNPHVQQAARLVLDMSAKLRQGVWHACIEALSIFEDPVVAQNTKKSEVFLDDLLHGISPISVYLCMGFHEVTRLGRFLGLFVETLVTLVSAPHAPARHPLLLCLDEMANLGKLTELEKSVSYLQGSGCQAMLVFQNVNQIVDTYGPTSPLLSSMSTTVFYAPVPTDRATAELVSKSLGTRTIVSVSASQSTTNDSTSQSQRARPLMTPDEVTRLPKTDALILLQEQAPIYARKLGQRVPGWYERCLQAWMSRPEWMLATGVVALMAYALSPFWYAHNPSMSTAAVSTLLGIPLASSGPSFTPSVTPSTTPSTTPSPSSPLASLAPEVRTQLERREPGTWRMVWQETIQGETTQTVKRDDVSEADCRLYLSEAIKLSMSQLKQHPSAKDLRVDESDKAPVTWRYVWQPRPLTSEPRSGKSWCEDAANAATPTPTFPLPRQATNRDEQSWFLYSQPSWSSTPISSLSGYTSRTDCMSELTKNVDPLIKGIQASGSVKGMRHSVTVDRSQENKIRWTVTYLDDKRIGGLAVSPGTQETDERWCAQKGQ